MARYLVAVCPYCGEIQAFSGRYKRKRCVRCGRFFMVSSAKILGEFDNAYRASEFTRHYKLRRAEGDERGG